MNNYQILGIANNSSMIIIKQSYRELVKIYHPDKNTGDVKKFLEVQKAYEELSKGITNIETSYARNVRNPTVEESFKLHKITQDDAGNCYLHFTFNYIQSITGSGKLWRNTWTIKEVKTTKNIVITKEDLKKCNYLVELNFWGWTTGNYLSKIYKIKKPENFFWRMINKLI